MSGIHDRDKKLARVQKDTIKMATLTAIGTVNCLFVPWFGGRWWFAVAVVAVATLMNLALWIACLRSDDLGPL